MTDFQSILASLRPPVLISGHCSHCGDPLTDPAPRDFDCQVMTNGRVSADPAIGLCETCGATAHEAVKARMPGKLDKSSKGKHTLGKLIAKVKGKADPRVNAYLRLSGPSTDTDKIVKEVQPNGPATHTPPGLNRERNRKNRTAKSATPPTMKSDLGGMGNVLS